MSKNRNKAVIPAILRPCFTTVLSVQFVDLALNDHRGYHGKEKAQQHQQYGLVPGGFPNPVVQRRHAVTADNKEKIHVHRPYTTGKNSHNGRQDLTSGYGVENFGCLKVPVNKIKAAGDESQKKHNKGLSAKFGNVVNDLHNQQC